MANILVSLRKIHSKKSLASSDMCFMKHILLSNIYRKEFRSDK